MKELTKDLLIQLVYNALPFSNQIKELDTTSEKDAIRFIWRGNKLRVSISTWPSVELIGDSVLIVSDLTIVIDKLLKREYLDFF